MSNFNFKPNISSDTLNQHFITSKHQKLTPLFCLLGPTAAGKSHLAHRLALEFNSASINTARKKFDDNNAINFLGKSIEIISLDSALIYQNMNIGTAKPSTQELQEVNYHLINISSILHNYNVSEFLRDVKTAIHTIWARGNIPILVGGTMMYYQALSKGLDDLPEKNASIRADLERQAQTHSWPYMHAQLLKADPISAEKIKPSDKQRIERALEVYLITGQPMSSMLGKAKGIPTQTCYLNTQRPALHALIAGRFNKMLDLGLIEEVQQLQKNHPSWNESHTSQRLVGYKQTLAYLQHKNLKQLQEEGLIATRQLAKRQQTWLRQLAEQENIQAIHTLNHVNVGLEAYLEHAYQQLKTHFYAYCNQHNIIDVNLN